MSRTEPVPVCSVVGESYAVDRALTGGLAAGTVVSDLDLEDCTIEGGVLERTTWRRCSLLGCTVSLVDLSMSRFVDVRVADSTIRDSKAQAVDWCGLRPGGLAETSIRFERCRLDYGSFMELDCRGMRFVSCSLVEADFAGADCREVELVDCDLSGARFTRADLRGALVTGARGLSLDVRESRTSGLRLDPASALDVVTALGIDIVDPPGD